jgi:AcrR family transcriptional regulator
MELPTNARERLGHQTRERLLDVAAGLVLRGSVSAMSISELVQMAGVPASSIYWHFRSKEGLVAAVAAAAVERWLALLPDPQTLPATGEARVVAGIDGITAALASDGRIVTLVIKVGVELGAGRHSALEIMRGARADVIRYGVRVFAPAFQDLSEGAARAAAERMSALLMATADGIAVNAAVEGRGAAAAEEYRVLGELAVLLYRQLGGQRASRRSSSLKRSAR